MDLTDAQKFQLVQEYATDSQKYNSITLTNALSASQTGATASTLGFSTAIKGLGVSLKSLAAAHPYLTAIAAIGAVVFGAVKIYDSLTVSIEEAREAMMKAEQTIADSQNKLKEVSSTISENKARFLELSQGVDKFSHNLHLSEEDYAEYLSISQKLAKLSPSLVYGYDEQGNALLQIGDNAEETKAKLNEVLETQQAITTQTLLDNMNSVAEGIAAEVTETEDELKNLKSELTDLQESHAEVQFDIINNGQFLIDDSAESSKYKKALEDSLNEANIVYTITANATQTQIDIVSATEEDLQKAQSLYNNFLATEENYYKASENGLKRDIAEKESKISGFYSDIIPSLQAYVSKDYNYQSLSDGMTNFVDVVIPQIRWDELAPEDRPQNEFDYQRYVRDNILNPLMDVPDKHKAEVNRMLQKLLSFEEGDLDILPFAIKVKEYFAKNNIAVDITPIITNEQKAQDKLQNSIEAISAGGKANFTTSSGVMADLDEYNYLLNYTKDFDAAQIELWNESTLGATNATEATKKYEKALEDAATKNNLPFSISETVDKIDNELNPAMKALASAYQNIFTSDGFTKANINNDMLSSIKTEIDDLNKMDGINIPASTLKNFAQVLSDPNLTETQAQEQFDSLANTIVHCTDCTRLSAENFNVLATSLTGLGLTNAGEVLTKIKTAQEEITAQGYNLATITEEQARQFIEEGQAGKQAVAYLQMYMVQKQLTAQPLNTYADIEALASLCTSLGVTGEMLQAVLSLKSALGAVEAGAPIEAFQSQIDEARENIAELAATGGDSFKFNFGVTDDTASTKDIEQELDLLSDLNSELDELQSSYDSLKEAKDTYNKHGKITADQAQELINTDLRLLALMGEEENAYTSLADAKLEEMKVQLARNALNTLNSLQTEADAVEYLAMANVNLRDQTLSANQALLQQAVLQKQGMGGAMSDAATTIWQGYQNAVSMIGSTDFGFTLQGVDNAAEETEAKVEEFEKQYNWIENLLDKLSKVTEKWKDASENFFSWWQKNAAVNKAITANRNELNANRNAYNYYQKKANEVGLSGKYKNLIAGGSLKVEDITDEDLSTKIDKYQEWYDKMQECKDAIEELYEQERELIRQKYDNILDYYETIDGYYDSLSGKLEASISLQDAKGQKQTFADLLNLADGAIQKSSRAEEKDFTYKLGDTSLGESPEYYQKQLDSIDENLKATQQYQGVLENIDKLEAKRLAMQAKGKELSKAEKAQLEQYYALKRALETNATQDTIAEYTKIYNKWYALQAKLDAGKALTLTQRMNYDAYTKQLQSLSASRQSIETDLETSLLDALAKQDNTAAAATQEQIAADRIADATARYNEQTVQLTEDTKNTSVYRSLTKKIAQLEQKRATLQAKGKDLSANDLATLEKYYANQTALEENATAYTAADYSKIWNNWYKLSSKQDSGKTLTKNEQARLHAYEKQLEMYQNDRADEVKQLQDELDNTITQINLDKAANLDDRNALIEADYSKLADELRESYNAQIDAADGGMEDTSAYKKLVANIENKQAELDKLLAIDENSRTKAQNKRIQTLQTQLADLNAKKEAVDAGATKDNITDYINTYDKLKKLQDKLDLGKTLTAAEKKNYDIWTAKLQGYVEDKSAAIKALEDELADALTNLELERNAQIAENETAVLEAQTEAYEYLKQLAEFNVSNLATELELLDALTDNWKSYADLYNSIDVSKLKEMGFIADDTDASNLELLTEAYEQYLSSASASYDKLIEQKKAYESLLSALDSGDFTDVFNGINISDDLKDKLFTAISMLEENAATADSWRSEWNEALSGINADLIENVELIQSIKDEMLENVKFKALGDLLTKLDYAKTSLSDFASLINDDFLYDENGNLTEYGVAKSGLLLKQLEATQKEAAVYNEKMQVIKASKDDYANEDAYNAALSEAMQSYIASLSDAKSLSDELADLYTQANENEVTTLKTVISARKEALQSKKDYYDYDKTIKTKTKDIEALQSQIDALHNVDTAEAKAKKAQLSAQLQDAQDDLEDTMLQHEFGLQTEALDDFTITLENALTTSTESVTQTLESQREIIEKASRLYETTNESIEDTLEKLMAFYGGMGIDISGEDLNPDIRTESTAPILGTELASAASANTTASTAVTLPPSASLAEISALIQNGITVHQAEAFAVSDAQMAQMMNSYMPQIADVAARIPELITTYAQSPVVNIHYDNLMNVQGSIDATVVNNLPVLLRQACDYTKKDIYTELKLLGNTNTTRRI